MTFGNDTSKILACSSVMIISNRSSFSLKEVENRNRIMIIIKKRREQVDIGG